MVPALCWIAVACGDGADRAGRRDDPAPARSESAAADERETELPAEEPGESDVAEPDERGRLEAECFAGSTEACDRLGH